MGKIKQLLQDEETLDVLDLDYQYDLFMSNEDMKEAMSHLFWNQRVSMNGMTYGRIQELNNLEMELERNGGLR